MKSLFKDVIFLFLLFPLSSNAESVTSPDGNLVVNVSEREGTPVYSVSYNGITFIEESPLGLKMDIGDMSQGMALMEVSPSEMVSDSYSLPNIKKSKVDYTANRRSFTFAKDEKKVYDIVFQVSNNDVAYRYELSDLGDTKSAKIDSEASSFVLPEGTTTFLCPQMLPMTGFARTAPSYETSYTADDEMGKNGWGDGYVFPALFRNGDNGWILISETGLDGSYCGSHIENRGSNVYGIAFPNPKELNGLGSSSVGVSLPCNTPWRTITIGETLRPIGETTIANDLVQPKYKTSKQYKYGKGTWSWIMRMDGSCNYDEQKEYIDFASDMGYNSVLIDALWDTMIGRDRIAELAEYGKSKGVDIFLWYNSNGYWNDAPQGPRGYMNNSHVRRDEMKWMQETGIRGIKVDFFGGDKQPMIQLYEDILSDANDYGLEVIFHGCTLPRGWERMYPNFVASEAVRASENLYFGQHECDMESFNATFHPVVRNTVGSMDFGGSALNKYYNKSNEKGKGNTRRTSDVFALATAVMFQSPVQHFALAPNNLTDAPDWAIQFMKDVPTTWDDVEFIDGYPGRYIIMARKHGDKWYVTGINAQESPLKTTITVPWAPKTEIKYYSDDAALNGSVKTVKVSNKGTIDVEIPYNGAFVAVNQ